MEGINHEAIGLAGHLGLGRLIVLWDDNKITIDGATSLSTSEDIHARYEATGWHVVSCNGHDFADIRRALAEAAADPRPSLVACNTTIGYGAPRSEEHTSELQSLMRISYAVFCLKKNKKSYINHKTFGSTLINVCNIFTYTSLKYIYINFLPTYN